MSKNVNVKKIAEAIQNSELSLIESQKANYQVYLGQFAEYKKLSEMQRKAVAEETVKDNPAIELRATQNKWSKMMTADKLGIDISLYVSFNKIYDLSKKVKKGTASVVKKGKDKGKVEHNQQAENTQKLKEEGVQIANDLAMTQIVTDEKVIELLGHCITQGYDLNLVSKAILKMAKTKK